MVIAKKPRVLIYDLDGVVVDSSERSKLINYEAFHKGDYEAFYRSIVFSYARTTDGDVAIDLGINIVNTFRISKENVLFRETTGDKIE